MDNVVTLQPPPPPGPRRRPARLTILLPLAAVLAAIWAHAASPVLQGRALAALEALGLVLRPLLPDGAVYAPGEAEGGLSLLACQLDFLVEELAKVPAWRELHLQCAFLLSDLQEIGVWSRAVA